MWRRIDGIDGLVVVVVGGWCCMDGVGVMRMLLVVEDVFDFESLSEEGLKDLIEKLNVEWLRLKDEVDRKEVEMKYLSELWEMKVRNRRGY